MAEDPLWSISRLGALSNMQTVSPNLHPGPLQGGLSPPPLVLSSWLKDGGAWRPRFPASPSPGTLLLAASWAGLTSQVEKHRSHSFHMRSSSVVSPHLQDAERGGGGRGQPASLLTRSAACPPVSPGCCGRGCRSRTCILPPLPSASAQIFFWGGGMFRGRAQSLMLFDQHVFSLELQRGWRAGAKGKGEASCSWSLSVWEPGPLCVRQSAHRTLVSAQEMATDTMTRPRDHSQSHSEGVTGQRQEPGPGSGDLTHSSCVLSGLRVGSRGGLGIPLLTLPGVAVPWGP